MLEIHKKRHAQYILVIASKDVKTEIKTNNVRLFFLSFNLVANNGSLNNLKLIKF